MRDAVRSRQASASEIVEAHLVEIERTNPRVNAFIEVYAEAARRRARGRLSGPLAGVAVTIKDSFDEAGRATRCGSLLRAGCVARRDATAVERLKAAGAVIVGRTSTPEFLYWWETDNRIAGPTSHPLDAGRTPGGSSGGEAAAIASFMSAGGVGSDGGGSIRQPAHFCGICGLKPTPGRVGAGGHWPEISHPAGFMGVAGPMARSVRDLRLLFETMAGYDVRDPFSAPGAGRSGPVRRIWVMAEDAAVSRAVSLLGAMRIGCEPLPEGLIDEAHELWRVLFVDLISQSLKEMVRGREADCSWTGLELMKQVQGGVTAERLCAVLGERDRMRASLLEAMGEETVILAPAFGMTAFPHRRPPLPVVEAARFCTPANLLGLPSLVVPVCTDAAGMPAGVQLIGAPWNDERLMDLGQRLEEARGEQWRNTRPLGTTTSSTTSKTD